VAGSWPQIAQFGARWEAGKPDLDSVQNGGTARGRPRRVDYAPRPVSDARMGEGVAQRVPVMADQPQGAGLALGVAGAACVGRSAVPTGLAR